MQSYENGYLETAHGYIMTTKRTARIRRIQRYKNQPPKCAFNGNYSQTTTGKLKPNRA